MVLNDYSENKYCSIYVLGSAHEKFDIWNKIAPQSKFQCEPLKRNSWVDP